MIGEIDKIAGEIRSQVMGRCLINELLNRHTSFKVGGPAALYVYPAGTEALSILLQICKDHSLETLIIGYGNNLLVSDDGFTGCVIDLTEAFNNIMVEDDRITAGAGAWLDDVVKMTGECGLSGLEQIAGIPSSVGGGMSMNCGAFGTYISDHLSELKIMELDGRVKRLPGSEVEFGYRTAPGLCNRIVLDAIFQLEKDKSSSVGKLIKETISERYRRKVMELPSAGSVFRNPEGHFAARLLESIGAKGMMIGGAEVSAQHANFILNRHQAATASDIISLINSLKDKVYKRYNLELNLELRLIGFDNGN
ncbi:MAG: UDP-N-acetylmuramate dehydrogenase [Candidatus Hatepunaea meridiana]|nr:UDP-N-acetylmuramate dehydrogenase [Candidatus Hatepunaea meridiana]